jgi:prevent-host-death family protein
MSPVDIKELKNGLTHYMRGTKRGEEIIVTEPGKPVAVLAPLGAARQVATMEAKLARLAARRIVTLPTRKPAKRVRRVEVSGRPVSQTVVEDRR